MRFFYSPPVGLSTLLLVILSQTATVIKAYCSSPPPSSSSSLLTRHHRSVRNRLVLSSPSTMKTVISTARNNNESNKSSIEITQNNTDSSLTRTKIWTTIYTKIGSTTSMFVAGTFFAALCWRRDALIVSFFLGAILNAIFGKILKRILKIQRPIPNGEDEEAELVFMKVPVRPSDNGMPSSHAMSLGFICTFVAFLIPKTTLPLLIYAVISLIYRVRTTLHSVDQIVVGAILGIFDGSIWYRLCNVNGFSFGSLDRGIGIGIGGETTIVEIISSSGIMNEQTGLLPWYLLVVPALVGAAVVGSIERRLGEYFNKKRSSATSDDNDNKID